MKWIICLAAGWIFLTSLATGLARTQYNKEFAKVVEANEALSKALGGKTNCNLCHAGLLSKKNRNEFGKAVESALMAKDVKDPKTIVKALAEAAKSKLPSDNSATFGDLIRAGTLPVTKEEPK